MLDQLTKQLFNEINDKVNSLSQQFSGGEGRSEAEAQIKAIIESGLRKLNLVTREEFDAQQAVLLRTREKLESLEKQIAEMQANATSQPPEKQ